MAKSKDKSESESKTSYKEYNEYHDKKANKDDFKVVQDVREKYERSRRARQNNCYWDSFVDGSAGDWETHWVKSEKMRLQWAAEEDSDTFQSNVKSPMATGRINAFVNEFKKINLAWDAKPNNDNDRGKAKIASKAMDWWYQTSNAKSEFVKVADSAAVYGSGFFRTYYLEERRNVRYAKTEGLSKEEAKEVKDGSKKTIWGRPVEILDKDEIAIEYVPIREIYPDANAWSLHGVTRAAQYVVRRRFMNIDNFKTKYKGNPNAKNVDMVKSASSYGEKDTYRFFETPKDVVDSESVEVLEYECLYDDKYCVVANDVLIIDTPLPYNHKQLSYHKVDFIKNPDQFYGIGLPDLVKNHQGSQEILSNMMYDYIYRAYHQRYFVDATSIGEVEEPLTRTDTALIPIDLSSGDSINQKVQQLITAPIGFDAFQMNDITERNGTVASGIDPSQLALMAQNKTATATMQNKEQLQSMIFAVIDNFVNEGWSSAGNQVWRLMKQFWGTPKIRRVMGDDDTDRKPEYKKIRLEGVEIDVGDNQGVEVKESKEKYSFFEMKGDYFKTDDLVDIMIRPDSIEIMSKSAEMQKMQEFFAQVIPLAANPENPQSMRMNPNAVYDIVKVAQRYNDIMGQPEALLIQPEVQEEHEEQRAMDDVMKIINGETVAGVPGSSKAHTKKEAQVLLGLESQIEMIENQIDKIMLQASEKQEAERERMIQQVLAVTGKQIDPTTGQPIMPQLPPMPEIQPPEELMTQLESLQDLQGRLKTHLDTDRIEEGLIEERSLAGNPQTQQPAPQGQGAPQMPPGADMNTPVSMPGGNPPMPQQQQVPMA